MNFLPFLELLRTADAVENRLRYCITVGEESSFKGQIQTELISVQNVSLAQLYHSSLYTYTCNWRLIFKAFLEDRNKKGSVNEVKPFRIPRSQPPPCSGNTAHHISATCINIIIFEMLEVLFCPESRHKATIQGGWFMASSKKNDLRHASQRLFIWCWDQSYSFYDGPVESWTSRLSIEPHWQLMEKVPLWNMTVPLMDEESGKKKKKKRKKHEHDIGQLTEQKTFGFLRQMGSQHLQMTGSGVESLLLLCSLKSKMSAKGFGHFSIHSSKLLAWQGSANQRDGAGGTGGVMRSTEGNEDKDNDRGRKSRRGRIKLSTHLLGRVSAALGMKTLNPTVAQKGRNSRLDMSYYLSLGPNIHLPQTPACSSPFSSLLAPSCPVFVATFSFFFFFDSCPLPANKIPLSNQPTDEGKTKTRRRCAVVGSWKRRDVTCTLFLQFGHTTPWWNMGA